MDITNWWSLLEFHHGLKSTLLLLESVGKDVLGTSHSLSGPFHCLSIDKAGPTQFPGTTPDSTNRCAQTLRDLPCGKPLATILFQEVANLPLSHVVGECGALYNSLSCWRTKRHGNDTDAWAARSTLT